MAALGAPFARRGHSAVWTGSEMIVWGGVNHPSIEDEDTLLSTGGRYHPGSDTWAGMTVAGAPSQRFDHSAVWAGSEMIVAFGEAWEPGPGPDVRRTKTGGRYDPTTDSWSPMADAIHDVYGRLPLVWTGSVAVAWGEQGNPTLLNEGQVYDPSSDVWTPTAMIDAPGGRSQHGAVWNGLDLLVWGGQGGLSELGSGGALAFGYSDDADLDGFSACGGDCNDFLPGVHPGAPETCNRLDDDCDGMLPPEEADADMDGWPTCLGDCDDSAATDYPGAPEYNDGVDNGCPGNGLIDEGSDESGFTGPTVL